MNRNYFLMLSASAGMAILAGAGCRTSVNTVENAERQGMRQMISDSRVITDKSLNRKVNVVGINSATRPNGILQIQIEVMNLRGGVQSFFYNIEWFDEYGMRVSTATGGWTERQIMGKEIMTIVAVAPSPVCKDFRIKLIEDPR